LQTNALCHFVADGYMPFTAIRTPRGAASHAIVTVTPADILYVTNKKIKVRPPSCRLQQVCHSCQVGSDLLASPAPFRIFIGRLKNCESQVEPDNIIGRRVDNEAISMATQQLLRLAEEGPAGGLKPVNMREVCMGARGGLLWGWYYSVLL
jgi:hypothetical protein